jgi:hypothetical protein
MPVLFLVLLQMSGKKFQRSPKGLPERLALSRSMLPPRENPPDQLTKIIHSGNPKFANLAQQPQALPKQPPKLDCLRGLDILLDREQPTLPEHGVRDVLVGLD